MAQFASKYVYPESAKPTSACKAGWDCPWSSDCDGAPWWVDYSAQSRMAKFADDLLNQSQCTPDASLMNTHDEQLVFVYGSLKRGFAANDMLDRSQFVSRGWTSLKRFKLYETKDFPVALFVYSDDNSGKALQGEVYRVPTTEIKNLDHYESNGVLFRRRKLTILLDSGEIKLCWMYFGIPAAWSLSKLAPTFTRKKTGVEYYSYTKK